MIPSKKHSKKIPMKHLHLLLVVVGLSIAPALQAQYQQFHSMPYQGVARNASGQPVANQNIRVRFILQYGLSNAYIESQLLTTNAFGVFNAQIGDGTPEPAPSHPSTRSTGGAEVPPGSRSGSTSRAVRTTCLRAAHRCGACLSPHSPSRRSPCWTVRSTPQRTGYS